MFKVEEIGISKHKYSAVGRHLEEHGLPRDKKFSVLKKCRSMFDYLIFEMLLIKEYKKTLFMSNILRDSVCKYLTESHYIILKYFFMSLRNSFTITFAQF